MSQTVSTAVPDVSDRRFWKRPAHERAATWAELRRIAPVSFQAPSNLGVMPSARGYWAVTRHDDVVHVSRHPDVFCSGQGVGLSDIDPELMELNASFLMMDAPRHTKLRRVVSGAFTPRRVGQLEAAIIAEAKRIVDDFVDSGGGDVVQDLAMKLPLWTISTMMGVPESMRADLYGAAEGQVAAQDPEFAADCEDSTSAAVESTMTLHRLAGELVAMRRGREDDDILSALVHSELDDGTPLPDLILGGIFVLFSVAGNDTTRNTTSHAIKAFADNPAQWQLLAADPALMETGVEEMVRWASPVIHFRRTATADTELSGARIAAGDAVVMFYESANRDESTFEEPGRFDITRNPNPHVAFGGGGPHFCLGAHLARVQLRALFTHLVQRVETIEVAEPAYLISNFVNGVKRMPVTVNPR